MDNTVLPPTSKLKFEVNGEPSNATEIEWSTNRVMSQFRPLFAPFGDVVDLTLPVSNSKYRTALGAIVEPYDLTAVDLNLATTFDYEDPALLIDIEFDFDMNTSVTPTADQLEVLGDGIPIIPDSIFWDESRNLIIEATAEEFILNTLTVELLDASSNMITADSAVICKWKIDVII
jgi:hypothetical protein